MNEYDNEWMNEYDNEWNDQKYEFLQLPLALLHLTAEN